MPKDPSISKILVIGSGPIVIGQGCEFDYSGVQACKALLEEGYQVVLVNSNPATIMTDPEFATRTYIEPITPEIVEKIIEREKPDALLPTLGGQTALNTSMTLWHSGVLKKHNVRMIGAKADAIEKGENRMKFKEAMIKIGLDMPKSGIAHNMEEARAVAAEIGTFPLIIRPGFTLGGTGGGIAYNKEEFETICARGIDLSPVDEVLIDESLLGWKEFEMEVMRDRADNCVVICSIENLDPMGVHTGDSITVAPIQTLTDREYQIMRDASFAVIREIGVETGGSNIQFATHPETGRMIVIEMNPRVSRSSALASKATGFPIAKLAAKLAVGYTLDEIKNDITRETPASFEPTIDYCVVKVPRFTFEKFPTADATLTTQMKSVGEAMAIGRTFKESLQKALRSLETGRAGLGADGKDPVNPSRDEIVRKLTIPNAERIFWLAVAMREGFSVEEIFDLTKIDPWFLRNIEEILQAEQQIRNTGVPPVHGRSRPDCSIAIFHPYNATQPTDKTRRNLPHWDQPGTTVFVTFSTADSLPVAVLNQWQAELDAWKKVNPEPWDAKASTEYNALFIERRQEYLDQGHGACVLKQPAAAAIVADALRHFHGERYVLDHFVVMPNHVHVLFSPLPGHEPSTILQALKSFTSKALHKLNGTSGTFWMEESFDRIVRTWTRLEHYRQYILDNPAKAGLGAGEFVVSPAVAVVQTEAAAETLRSRRPQPCTGGTPVFLPDDLRRAKRLGFSDRQIAYLTSSKEDAIRDARKAAGIIPTYRLVDTCAAEFEAYTPYYYSTYGDENETRPSSRRKVMILGGGPNRIGQGIEFDYCCVHAAFALKELGFETIMVNSNPETVSTDYDTSDRLYFEPLTFEDVMNIYENEQCWGVIVQLGGQTPLNLAAKLEEAGCNIIGTSPKNIELAEDRKFFAKLLDDLKLNQAPSGTAVTEDEAVAIAQRISYPVLVRPSFVLGGRAMQIVYSDEEIRHYMRYAVQASPDRPVLVDRFLEDAAEVDVDVISDGETTVVGAIMEHIEQAGVHSGDSACVIPAVGLSEPIKVEIMRAAKELAKALNVIGLMNIQFAVKDEILYVIEVNPRASRTVPFVSKSIGRPLAKFAAKIMASHAMRKQGHTDNDGHALASLKTLGFTTEIIPKHYNVKEAVFPFSKFPGIDIALGPEMKSTGEVMGIDADHAMAFAKSQMAAGNSLPLKGKVFISVSERLKGRIGAIAKEYHDLGFTLVATEGTRKAIMAAGAPCELVHKIAEGRRPNILDMMKNGEIAMIINTPSEKETRKDEVLIRSTSVSTRTPIQTTLRGARAAAHAIGSLQKNKLTVKPLQEYF